MGITNEDIFNVLEKYGMIDETSEVRKPSDLTNLDIEDIFSFVDELFITNGENEIKNFIIILILKNRRWKREA